MTGSNISSPLSSIEVGLDKVEGLHNGTLADFWNDRVQRLNVPALWTMSSHSDLVKRTRCCHIVTCTSHIIIS